MMMMVPNRAGLWAASDRTPFGFGRAYTTGQIEQQMRAAGLMPEWHGSAIYIPALGPALLAPQRAVLGTGRRADQPGADRGGHPGGAVQADPRAGRARHPDPCAKPAGNPGRGHAPAPEKRPGPARRRWRGLSRVRPVDRRRDQAPWPATCVIPPQGGTRFSRNVSAACDWFHATCADCRKGPRFLALVGCRARNHLLETPQISARPSISRATATRTPRQTRQQPGPPAGFAQTVKDDRGQLCFHVPEHRRTLCAGRLRHHEGRWGA